MREPYIFSKEPYMFSKEPYIFSKEPYISSKEPCRCSQRQIRNIFSCMFNARYTSIGIQTYRNTDLYMHGALYSDISYIPSHTIYTEYVQQKIWFYRDTDIQEYGYIHARSSIFRHTIYTFPIQGLPYICKERSFPLQLSIFWDLCGGRKCKILQAERKRYMMDIPSYIPRSEYRVYDMKDIHIYRELCIESSKGIRIYINIRVSLYVSLQRAPKNTGIYEYLYIFIESSKEYGYI